MADEGTVDVVVPTRERGILLGEALDCLRAQTVRPDRVVVVQDGSVVDEAVRNRHAWCQWTVNERGAGAAGARNTGLDLVSAPRVLFLDDDDLLDPLFLQRALSAFTGGGQREPVAVASGFRIQGPGPGRDVVPPRGVVRMDDLLVENVVGPTSFVLCDTEAVRSVGGFDETLPGAQDWDLWLRLAGVGKIVRIPEVLGTYRIHEFGQISSPTPSARYRKYRRFFDKRSKHPGFRAVKGRVAGEMYWWGDLDGAEEAFRETLSLAPLHWKARLMLTVLKTPFRRPMLRLVYRGREGRIWLEDRREPLPLR